MRFAGLSTHIRILCLCLLIGQVVSVLSGAPGDLDSTFGAGGQLLTAVGSGDAGAHDLALQNDGKVVAVGYFHNGTDDDFAVARYNPDGTLDTGFNGTGIATTDFGGNSDTARGVAIQPDGKIVVVGVSLAGGAATGLRWHSSFLTARWTPISVNQGQVESSRKSASPMRQRAPNGSRCCRVARSWWPATLAHQEHPL
jgi:uncharacterized delta-60 repeat protein